MYYVIGWDNGSHIGGLERDCPTESPVGTSKAEVLEAFGFKDWEELNKFLFETHQRLEWRPDAVAYQAAALVKTGVLPRVAIAHLMRDQGVDRDAAEAAFRQAACEGKNEFFVLKRDEERMVVVVTAGNDPLYGMGSWDLASGPYSTWEEAESNA